MKKEGIFLLVLLLLIFPIISAQNSTINSTETEDKIEKGFECLEAKAGDCSSLTNQEIALTILATPDEIFDDCVEELQDRESSDNWGNVRDTALAVLALKHAGKDTQDSEEWLLGKSRTPTELIWYMEEDSEGETQCHIGYDSTDYLITLGENKKIDQNAGSCLTRAQSNFWLQIAPECFGKEFTLECDKDFIGTLLYKNKNSPTIYVLEGTKSAQAYGSMEIKVNSKCFGDTSSCDYEATLWATFALLKTGYDVEEYFPYIIAMSETNKRYLPDAFIYMVTNYEGYATKLASAQKLGNYWEADSTAYSRYYDTSLAILSLGGSSSEQITNAKSWLLFSQGSDGCWQGSVRDTAIALWALEGRSGKNSEGGGITYCSQAGYYCIPSSECPTEQDVGDAYYCSVQSETCCMSENLKSCSGYSGSVCGSNEVCTGNERKATDTEKCCTGECVERPTETECESMFYSCRGSCLETEEEISYSCNSGQVCCRTKTETEKSLVWKWILIIGILVVLIIIGYLFREKLKLLWFKLKIKFKKDKGGGSSPPGGPPRFPPQQQRPPYRQGFPPLRNNQNPVNQRRIPRTEEKENSDVFSRLREMSK
ncbi:MAG: hypothetical protein WC494_02290 [Candidatus Pacearchaeota archaeon]